jgi:hypothetical protein
MGWDACDFFSFEKYPAAPGLNDAYDRFEGRTFSHTVAAQQANDFPCLHIQAHPLKNMASAIEAMDLFQFKH